MRVLVVDNYDSFVYNIAQRLGELKTEPTVIRNDKVTVNTDADQGQLRANRLRLLTRIRNTMDQVADSR